SLAFLFQASRALAATLDLNTTIKTVLDFAPRLGAQHAYILLTEDPATGQATFFATVPGLDQLTETEAHNFAVAIARQGLEKWVLEHGQSALVPDTRLDDRWYTDPSHAEEEPARCVISVPLRSQRGAITGVLAYTHPTPNAFAESQLLLVESFAAQVAVAIDNARLYQHLGRQQQHATALAQATQALSQSPDQTQLWQTLAAQFYDTYQPDGIVIYLWDAEALTLTPAASSTLPEEARSWPPVGQALAAADRPDLFAVVQSREARMDKLQDLTALGLVREVMILPLLSGGQVEAVVEIAVTSPAVGLSVDDLQLARSILISASYALQTARLYEETRQRLTEQNWLYQITTAATGASSLDLSLQQTVQALRSAMRQALVTILLTDESTQTLRVQAALGYEVDLSRLELRLGQGIVGWVALSGEAARFGDVRLTPRYVEGVPGIRSELAVPLKLGKRVIGVVNLESRDEDEFTEHDERLLSTLSSSLAAIISNAQLFEGEQRQRRAASTLAEAAARMSETLSETALRQVLVDGLFDYLQPDQLSLYEWIPSEKRFALDLRRDNETQTPMEMTTLGARDDLRAAFAEREAQWRVVQTADGPRGAYLLPWSVGDTAAGMIEIIRAGPEAALRPEEQLLCAGLADQAANALRLARLYAEQREIADRLREVDRLKSQFLANMSHELRTPLNSIIGFSRVIMKGIDGPVSDLQVQDLGAIHGAGQHLLGLINDILDLSRIEAGKMDMNFEKVELPEIIKGVLSTTTGLIKDKPVRLVNESQPDLPPVFADSIRIRQVLLNLLSNAAKFTDEGTITLTAAAVTDGAPHPMVKLSVRDSGMGIAEDDLPKLFQSFSQVDGSATRKTGGTGLGLAICKNLVELHGGSIWVESAVGKGSAFIFTLPVFQPKPELPAEASGLDGDTILVVDDDARLIDLYRRYLEPQGFRVHGLPTGEEVLAAARAR
ncbi:MAG: GAF domain-containing protein, partial [Chloroflexota bacterium]